MTIQTEPLNLAFLLCEQIIQEPSGAISLIHLADGITVPVAYRGQPIAYPLGVYTRWVQGAGRFREEVRALAPGNGDALASSVLEFQMAGDMRPHQNLHRLVLPIADTPVGEEALYIIELLLNDEPFAMSPFRVTITAPGLWTPNHNGNH